MPKMERIYRKLSPQERKAYDKLHVQLDAERPEIEAWAREALSRMETIDRVVSALRAARMSKGISLSQVEQASGLGRSNVSRLENHPDPNPTLDTLLTYADALGVELRIAVVDKKAGTVIDTTTRAA